MGIFFIYLKFPSFNQEKLKFLEKFYFQIHFGYERVLLRRISVKRSIKGSLRKQKISET